MYLKDDEILFSAADLSRLFEIPENAINLILEAMGLQERPEGFDPTVPAEDTGIRWRMDIILEMYKFLKMNETIND